MDPVPNLSSQSEHGVVAKQEAGVFRRLHPFDVLTHRGNDGLRTEDLPELETRVIVREESPLESALIRKPLADRNQFLQQHVLQPTLRSVIPDCYGVNVNPDQVRHLAKPDTP